MSSKKISLLSALLIFSLLFSINKSNIIANAENKTVPEVTVFTYEDLITEVKKGKNVKLGCDITVPDDGFFNTSAHQSYQNFIDTGDYTIFVKGNIVFGENSVILGSGKDNAVVCLIDDAQAGSVYNQNYNPPELHALSVGGTALSISEDSLYIDTHSASFLNIYAKNGTGIYAEAEISILRNFIEADYGIISTQPVNIYLSSIKSSTKAIDAPAVNVDTTNLSPYSSEYGEIKYRNLNKFFSENTIIPINSNVDDYLEDKTYLIYSLSHDGLEDIEFDSYLTFKETKINTDKEDIYYLEIIREEWMDLCGLKTENPYPVYVRDLRIPAFSFFYSFFNINAVDYKYLGDIDVLTLWCSKDEGKTWFVPEDANYYYSESQEMVELTLFDKENLWLMWEVEDIGNSEILKINWNDLFFSVDLEGDRNGGDREEQKPKPSPTPKPTDKPIVGSTPPPTATEKPPISTATPNPTLKPPAETAPPQATEKPVVGIINPTQTPTTTEKPISSPSKSKSPDAQTETNTETNNENNDNEQVITENEEYSNNQSFGTSGKRISAMLNNKKVAFFHNDMRITMSSDYFKNLNLNEDDIFEITLYSPDKDSFIVDFSINGSKLPEIYPTEFDVRINGEYDTLFCSLNSKDFIPAVINLTEKTAEFTLQSVGNYTLSSSDLSANIKDTDETFVELENSTGTSEINKNSDFKPVLIIAVLCSLASILLAILLYKSKNKRKQRKP